MGFTSNQPVYPKVYYVIMASKKLQSSQRKQALAEIRRMHTDPIYARRVNYNPEATDVNHLCIWTETVAGHTFWGDIFGLMDNNIYKIIDGKIHWLIDGVYT